MAMLCHFLRVPRNFEIFHDRLGPGLRDDVTTLILQLIHRLRTTICSCQEYSCSKVLFPLSLNCEWKNHWRKGYLQRSQVFHFEGSYLTLWGIGWCLVCVLEFVPGFPWSQRDVKWNSQQKFTHLLWFILYLALVHCAVSLSIIVTSHEHHGITNHCLFVQYSD